MNTAVPPEMLLKVTAVSSASPKEYVHLHLVLKHRHTWLCESIVDEDRNWLILALEKVLPKASA